MTARTKNKMNLSYETRTRKSDLQEVAMRYYLKKENILISHTLVRIFKGPSLQYFGLPVVWLLSASSLDDNYLAISNVIRGH